MYLADALGRYSGLPPAGALAARVQRPLRALDLPTARVGRLGDPTAPRPAADLGVDPVRLGEVAELRGLPDVLDRLLVDRVQSARRGDALHRGDLREGQTTDRGHRADRRLYGGAGRRRGRFDRVPPHHPIGVAPRFPRALAARVQRVADVARDLAGDGVPPDEPLAVRVGVVGRDRLLGEHLRRLGADDSRHRDEPRAALVKRALARVLVVVLRPSSLCETPPRFEVDQDRRRVALDYVHHDRDVLPHADRGHVLAGRHLGRVAGLAVRHLYRAADGSPHPFGAGVDRELRRDVQAVTPRLGLALDVHDEVRVGPVVLVPVLAHPRAEHRAKVGDVLDPVERARDRQLVAHDRALDLDGHPPVRLAQEVVGSQGLRGARRQPAYHALDVLAAVEPFGQVVVPGSGAGAVALL